MLLILHGTITGLASHRGKFTSCSEEGELCGEGSCAYFCPQCLYPVEPLSAWRERPRPLGRALVGLWGRWNAHINNFQDVFVSHPFLPINSHVHLLTALLWIFVGADSWFQFSPSLACARIRKKGRKRTGLDYTEESMSLCCWYSGSINRHDSDHFK